MLDFFTNLPTSIEFILIFVVIIAIFSFLTNPFIKLTIIKDPLKTTFSNQDIIILNQINSLLIIGNPFFALLAKLKSGWHIVSNRFFGRSKTKNRDLEKIIEELHEIRFDPDNPYLISGDHFSMLYPRSLGIFYHSTLDNRTALNQLDWFNRQQIYLKTLAYALEAYRNTDSLSTTIVPMGLLMVLHMNIYAYPSDTLYSLLYAFDQLLGSREQIEIYDFENEKKKKYDLRTKETARLLLDRHLSMLQRHYYTYFDHIYDKKSGLIKTDILLSGTKDIFKKKGGFYDNVILWKTTKLAQKLGIIEKDEKFLSKYRQRIIKTYWQDHEGFFLEDLSQQAKNKKWYSSDWLITYMTQFLTVENDLAILEKAVDYIQDKKLDQPFGLRYNHDIRLDRLYWPVRIGGRGYASYVIWSNWGMEYIKLLLSLYQKTKKEKYFKTAKDQLRTYTRKIIQHRGYPETYDKKGNLFTSLFYKSIIFSGWIVSYEQAREYLQAIKKEKLS